MISILWGVMGCSVLLAIVYLFSENKSEKSVAILSFALPGFANIGSVGIVLGIMLGIAPRRNKEIQSMAGKSLFAATIANLLNGAIIGMFFF